jgi:hypothetical protein
MKQQEFIIKFYGKSELAMLYYDGDSPENAMSKFRVELKRNPRLCHLVNKSIHRFTPRQVKIIVEELGDPY